MSKFESIFSSNTEIDPNLNELFQKKIERKSDALVKTNKAEKKSKSEDDDEKKSDKKIKKFDQETEKRTVFVGNLPKESKKEDLLKIFKSYGKIESVRFRNIVPEDLTKPKKYAYITKQIHPNKQTINGFVRFQEEDSAKNAASEVNGMEFKSCHLRVDIATRSKVHDNQKSVFIGGLPFDASDEDVYSNFSECGPIEFVRVIRDNKTGIGKGFGYVQFKTSDTVSLALRLDGTTINERKIRVSRCVKKQKEAKNDNNQNPNSSKNGNQNRSNNNNNNNNRNNNRNQSVNKFQSRSEKFDSEKKKRFERKDNSSPAPGTSSSSATKDKIPRSDRAKNFKLNKGKNKKNFKKKHISTNSKSQVKFRI